MHLWVFLEDFTSYFLQLVSQRLCLWGCRFERGHRIPTYKIRQTSYVGKMGEKFRGAEGDCQRGWHRSSVAQMPCTGHGPAPRQKSKRFKKLFLGKGKPKSVGERHLPLPQAPSLSAFLADNKRKYADYLIDKGAVKSVRKFLMNVGVEL